MKTRHNSLLYVAIMLLAVACGEKSSNSASDYFYDQYKYYEDRANKAEKSKKKAPHDAEYYEGVETSSRSHAEYYQKKYEEAKARETLEKEREKNLK